MTTIDGIMSAKLCDSVIKLVLAKLRNAQRNYNVWVWLVSRRLL